MIIGLDVSTSLGWATSRLDEDDSVGVVASGAIALPSKLNPIEKIDRVRLLFDEAEAHAVEHIVGVYVEGVPFVRQAMAHASYWRIRTVIEIVAAQRGLYPLTEVNVSALKKWATGKGNATKALMCRAVRDRFGLPLYARKDDDRKGSKAQEDEADAVLVAAWAHS